MMGLAIQFPGSLAIVSKVSFGNKMKPKLHWVGHATTFHGSSTVIVVWMGSNIVKCFGYQKGREVLYKYRPFTILPKVKNWN